MSISANIDLFSLGITTAVIGILGFIVFFNNHRNIVNRTFLLFSLATIFYSIFNYLAYQFTSPSLVIWLLRTAIFFVVWHAFGFFQLFLVFPEENKLFSKTYRFLFLPFVSGVSLLTFTPLVFFKIEAFSTIGRVSKVINGPGIFLFGLTVIGLIIGGIFLLISKILKARASERDRFIYLLLGSLITFPLYIIFNFIMPAFYSNADFIPFAPIFSFPFFAFTAYAILKYHILDVKIIATEIFTLLLLIFGFAEILLSKSPQEIIFRTVIFFALLIFSILLIRSVQREVRQREQLERLTAQLENANETLKRLDQAKSEFISIASHQLRAPLTVIKGYISLMQEGSFGKLPAATKEPLFRIFTSAEQLVRLVNDFLNLSRIEAGKIRYEFKPTDFAGIISAVIAAFKPNADKKGIAIEFANKDGSDSMLLDEDKTREVVTNLVDNAIKYTSQGKIHVTLERKDPQTVRLSVRDNGMGIKKEDIARLFTKFTRTPEARKVSPDGTGIGLYFVKRAVEDQGGKVGVQSEGLGKGSTFWVEFPVKG